MTKFFQRLRRPHFTSELARFHGIDKQPLLNNLHIRTESTYRMLKRMTQYRRIYRPES